MSWLWLWSGCATLDSLLYNPIHCTAVTEETCSGPEEPFDRVCVPCEEPYDWGKDYPWPEGTLAAGQSVRPVPAEAVQALSIPTEDGEGTLDAYFLSSHGEDPLLADVTLVYNHGRFAGIEHYQPRVRFLYEAGYNVFVWDYRGFGKSEPAAVPTPEQQLADARTALAEARGLAPNAERVIPYAYSAGAVPGTEMALDDGICAVILEAPFTSLANIAESGTRLSLGEQFFSSGLLDNTLRMEQVDWPVFGMIGTEDETVPGVENARELVEAGGGPAELWVVEGASHGIGGGGIPEDAGLAEYLAELTDFVTARCP
jgi:uncharacterized protein